MIKALIATVVGLTLNHSFVTRVIDGDTLEVEYARKAYKIRMYGIDAPEKKQPFGQEATNCASSYLLGKQVTIKAYGTDLYGRTLGEVFLQGRNQNIYLVSLGCAWATPKYLPVGRLQDYIKPQQDAMRAKLGLWAKPDPIEPEIWRKSH